MTEVEKLAAVKDKKREIEQENQELAKENEELRTFSMNGYKIAESVNQLSAEREKLTIDLADQAETIKNLLEQNRKLQKQIEMVRGNKENKQMSSDRVMGSKRPQKRVTFDQVR
jgi:flagellar motility protein MotE (MotC chaperone)